MGGGIKIVPDFGSGKYLFLAFLTVVIILGIQLFAKGFILSLAIIIGLIAGKIVGSLMGLVTLAPVAEATWFHFPQSFYFGAPIFKWSSILTMILILIVSMVESTGVYFALGEVTGQTIEEVHLKKGYRAEELAIILGEIFNTFPYTAF
ncbi:Permease family protein [Carnobacterium iners]|nr:Permease family protein [Carnobacterium iners]